MSSVYVREQGAVVRKRGERLVVTQKKQSLLDLPLLHLSQLVVFGNVQLTAPAVALLLQREVDVVFLSQRGKFRGRLLHTGSKFARLRHAQLRVMSDSAANLAIAKQVVAGKLANQRALLQGAAKLTQGQSKHQQAIHNIGRAIQKAKGATNADSLRGFEGSAGAQYWGAFRPLLKHNLGFQGRKYFPPPDPVNALLSFGYSLLLKDVTAAVQLVGLDPYLGFFHTIEYARPSLALDMMEEFRPVVVDPVVLTLVNRDKITENNFERTTNPKLPVRLTEPTIDLLIQQYEQLLSSKVRHPDSATQAGGDGYTPLRRVIELQVRRLSKVVLGQAKQYRAFEGAGDKD